MVPLQNVLGIFYLMCKTYTYNQPNILYSITVIYYIYIF
jgi:hypothetical protein